jgi:hypothetical protein
MEWMTTEAAIKLSYDYVISLPFMNVFLCFGFFLIYLYPLLGMFQMVAPYSIVDLARDI